jgi:pimeloyl-ACP methyl ester carboxylesterase
VSAFVPHAELVRAPQAPPPGAWALLAHGVFGSGANWRAFARKLVARRPGWGIALVDLRGHARSLGAPPPHDLDAAARDFVALHAAGGPLAGALVRAVIGHSLGGKVALAYAAARAGDPMLSKLFVLDARPGAHPAREAAPARVLALLRSLPVRFGARADFARAVRDRGETEATASWLAMSLERTDRGDYRLRLELDVIEDVLADHFRRDLWQALAHPPRATHVVVAGRSDVFSAADRARLAGLAGAGTAVHAHVLPDAGHWVHVDAPDALLELCARGLADE